MALLKNRNQGVIQSPGKTRLTLNEMAATGGQLRIRDVSNALWFPAGQPITPVAPRGTPPRRYAYQPMANINWATREGQIDHQALRNFSYYPIVRDIIETLKDLLCQTEWEFVLKPDADETKEALKERFLEDERLAQLKEFFRKPDGWQPFRVWARGLYDDMLVIDAASIWKQRDKANKVCALVQIDGAQVFPLIDETGQQPDSEPYDKVLVQTSTKKADKDYLAKMQKDKAKNGGKGSPAFQLTPYGFPAQEMTSDELTYAVYNRFTYRRYGYSRVEACLAYIAIALGRLDFQAAFYRSGNVPEGIAFLPPDVPVTKVDELNKYLDSVLAGNLKNRRKIFFLPSYGTDKQPNIIFPKLNDQVLKDEFDEWLARVLCHNFGLSPMAFTKQINRGEAKEMQTAQAAESVAPCQAWMKDLLDEIIQKDFGWEDIEARVQPKPEQDEEKLTGVCADQFSNGMATLNEVREKLGYDTIDLEWANVPLVKISTGYVRLDGLNMDGSDPKEQPQDTVPSSAIPSEIDGGGAPPDGGGSSDGGGKAEKAVKVRKSLDLPFVPNHAGQVVSEREKFDDPSADQTAETPVVQPIDWHDEWLEKATKRGKGPGHDWPNMERTNAYIGASRMAPATHDAKQRMQASLEKLFAKFRNHFKVEIKKAEGEELLGDTEEEIENHIGRYIEQDFWRLAPVLSKELKEAARAGTLMSIKDLDLTDTGMIEKVSVRALAEAEKRGAEMVGRRWVSGELVSNPDAKYAITDTTRDAIKALVKKVFEADVTVKEAKVEIQKALYEDGPDGVFSDYRAKMIARTEVARAQMGGQIDVWKASGLPLYLKWFAISEEPCEDCLDNDGVVVPMGEAFPSGWYSTLDSHPWCNCICSAVMSPDEAEE